MKTILTLVSALILSLGISVWYGGGHQNTAASANAVYARILQTKTIRCGYALWAPYIDRDPNTGKMSGIIVDIVEELGAYLHLKIDWVYEAGWGSFAQDLNVNRIDMMCAGVWPDAGQINASMLLQPILYTGLYPVVRADDTRFDKDSALINNPAFSISAIDGDSTVTLAHKLFPKARIAALPDTANDAQRAMEVRTGKADVMFVDADFFADYAHKNPGMLKLLGAKPVWMYGDRMAVKTGEFQLAYMMNTALAELVNAGRIDAVLARYPGVKALAPAKMVEPNP